MGDTKTVLRLYGAWSGEKEASWLGGMSQSGWHLVSCGLGYYRFGKGEPAEYIYEADFASCRERIGMSTSICTGTPAGST